MDIWENLGLRGRAFGNTLASLGDTWEDGPSRGTLGVNMGQLAAILRPTWGQLGPTWTNSGQHGPTWGQLAANLVPTWANMGQHGAKLGPSWGSLGANLGQLGPICNQLQPAGANISQRRPTWGQLEAHEVLKIIEKTLFFLGFSSILKKSLESFGKAFGGPFRDTLGSLWGRLGRLWGRLGKLWACLGRPWGRLGGTPGRTFGFPWRNLLERPSRRPPRIHVRAKHSRNTPEAS